ncbi:hypothetical protein [Nocardia pseudobrasiliensis]|uniref:PH (Pleckstrin Homology) domain-containing protein n=1 Tax=Nocardia pseudobrasiliensis TaxID=45979 RepID=A0A370IDI6_9NOCA|nr:hypothetical protein [Nocardia pseudobrasiliensis]RDI68789.1 hypothetical protein DFR76_101324 [Nocardia pseudobrasiliensis]
MSDNRSEAPLLPWATEWGAQRPRGNLVFVFAFVVLLFLLAIPFSIAAANQGDPVRTAFGAAIVLVAASSIIVVVPLLRVRRRSLPRDLETAVAVNNASGLKISYLTAWRRTLALWLAAGAVFLVIRGWLFLRQLIDGAGGSARTGLSAGGLVIVVIVLAMIGVLGWYLYSSRRRRGFVALTSDGVVQRLGRTSRRLPWSEIGGVSPATANNVHIVSIAPAPGRKVELSADLNWFDSMQRGSLERAIELPAWALGMDPALFLHLVRFYWQHPDARRELAGEAVVGRIRNGELLD